MREAVAGLLDCKDTGSINENGYQTVIAGKLLHAWATKGNDPAAVVAMWTWTGTPAGTIPPTCPNRRIRKQIMGKETARCVLLPSLPSKWQ